MMDDQKKTIVLQYISAVCGKTVDRLLDLKNGHFYMQVLGLLDQWNKKEEIFETDSDRLACVKKFLQDYYENDAKVDEHLNFDILLETDLPQCENDIELLLAKIAVVLLGVGILDKKREYFINAAMKLPEDIHCDVMAILQSVVQAGSNEVCLTTNIETVLMEPTDSQCQISAEKLFTWLQNSQNSIYLETKEEQVCIEVSPNKFSDDRKSPPICNLQKSHFMESAQTSTPKEFRYFASSVPPLMLQKDSPLRTDISALGHSLQEITSPLRGLNIDTTLPSSPLAQFVNSPQLAHKAFMKQKELEMRKMQQQLNEQIYQIYELQFNLQDKTSECVNKDTEISKLHDRIKELLHLRDSYDELRDLKPRHYEMEKEMDKLNKKLLEFELYKDQCQHLEKESSSYYEEAEKLHLKIETLEMEVKKYRDSLKTICQLETQVNALQLQIEVMHKMKTEWEDERKALQGNLEMGKETIDKLRHQLEEMQAKQEENAPGETMGIFMDMQLGELRCQVEDLKQENKSLLLQLQELEKTLLLKDNKLDQHTKLLTERDEVIAEMHNLCKSKEQDIKILKEDADLRVQMQEEIAIFKTAIEAKDAECLECKNKVFSLTVKVSELERELGFQSQKIMSLSDTKSQLEDALNMKEEELSSINTDLSSKLETITKLEADKVTTQKHLVCKEVEKEGLCQVNAQLKNETEQVKEQLRTQCSAVSELTEALQLKNTEILDLMARELSFSEAAKYLQTTCNELRAENEQCIQQLQRRDSELQQARDEHSAGNIVLLSLYEEHNKLKESIEEKSSMCKELQDLVSQHSHELLLMQGERDQVRNDLTNSVNEVKQFQESTHLMNEQFEALQAVKCELEEQIKILNSEIKANLEECSEYKYRVSSLTETVSHLEKELQTKSHELTLLSDAKSHLEEVLIMKEEELSSVHNDLSQRNEAITKLEADQLTTKKQLSCKEVESENLCQMNAQLKEETTQVKEQMTAQSNVVDDLTGKLNIKSAELLDLQSQKTSLEDARSTLEINFEDLKAKNIRCEQQLNVTESELQHITTQLTVQCSAVDKLTEALNVKSAEVLDMISQKVSLEDEFQQMKTRLAARNEELSAINEDMIRLKASVEEKSSLCMQLQDLVSQHSHELLMMQNERDQVKNDSTNFENEIKHLKDSIQLKNNQLQKQDIVKCELEEQINILNGQVKAKLEACSEYDDKVSCLSETVSHLEKELQSHGQKIISLSDTKSHIEETLKLKEQELSSVHNDLLHKNDAITKLEADQVTAKEHYRCKTIEIEELCQVNVQLKKEIAQVKEHLTAQSTAVDELTETLNIKSAELLDLQSQKTSLEDARRSLEINFEELRAKNMQLQDLASQHSHELLMMQNERDQVKNDLTNFENEIKQLKDSIQLKNNQLQKQDVVKCELEEQINILNGQVKAKLEECSECDDKVSRLSETVSHLEKELQSHGQKIISLSDTKSHIEETLKLKEQELSRVYNDLLHKNDALAKLEADQVTAKENYRCKTIEIEEHCQVNAQLKEQIAQVKEHLTAQSTAVDELTETLNIKSAELLDLQSQKTSLEDARSSLEINFEELRAKNMQLQDLSSQHSHELLIMQNERDQVKNDLTNFENEIKHLKDSIQLKNNQLQKQDVVKCELEEQINILNGQVKAKLEECSECDDKVSCLSETVSHLEKELQSHGQKIISLSDTKSHIEETLKLKEQELSRVYNNLLHKNDALAKLEADQVTAKENYRCKTIEIEEICQVNAQLKEQITQVKEHLTAQSNAVDELTETLNIKSAELLDLQSQKTSLEDARSTIEINFEELKAKNIRCEQQLNVTESEFQHIKTQLTVQCAAVDELTEALNVKSSEVLAEQSLKVSLKDELEQMKTHLAARNEEVSAINEDMIRLKASVEEKSSNVDELRKTLSTKNTELLDKSQLLKDLTHTVDMNGSRISDLIAKLENSTSSIANIQSEIQSKEQYISQLLKTNEEQCGSIEDLTVILQSKESAISELNRELEKQTSTNMLKINENVELAAHIQANVRLTEDLRAQLKSAEKELEQKCAILQQVSEELLHKDALVLKKNDELKQLSSDIQIVQEQLISREATIKLLETQLKAVKLLLQDTYEKLTDRKNVLVGKNVTEQQMKNVVSEITLSLKEKSNEITRKDSVINSLTEEHKIELKQIKEETENRLKCFQIKLEEAKESEMTSVKLEHEAQLFEIRQEHMRAISKAESEIASSKETAKALLVVKQEYDTKLNQLCEDLKLEQQAQRHMEQKLISQREIADRLEGIIELRRQEHEKIIQKVVEEHERKISSIEQNHSNKLTNFLAEKNTLLEENKELSSKVAELQENVTEIIENHHKTTQDLVQQSNLKTEFEQQLQEQKVAMDNERLTFNKSLVTKQEEIENVQAQLANVQLHIAQNEKRAKALQDENNSFRDRESKRLKESDAQMRTANEFCNNLRKQLDVTNKKMESSENEIKSFIEQSKRYELQVTKMKDTNTSLTDALKIERDTNMKMQKRMEGCIIKNDELAVKYDHMQKENKSYASEINKLKTSLDYADRKLRECQHQLDQAGTALLGDASHFRQIIEEKHFDSLDDSLDSRASITLSKNLQLRSRVSSGSFGHKSNLNETILSGDMVMLKRETLSSETDLRDKGLGKHQTEDRLSICSTSSSQSIKSMSGVPVACLPNAMSCANEPEGPEFEWDRLSELQRRNTLYLPHMKSAYPVEMQIVNKDKFSDDTLRLSLVPNRRHRGSPPNDKKNKRNETSTRTSLKEAEAKAYKRKAPARLIDEEISGESPPKQAADEIFQSGTIVYYPVIHTGPVYQRPGPPTPGKQPRRVSCRFTPSHGKSPALGGKIKLLGSPIARPNPRKILTPRRSPRLSSPLPSLDDDERRESVAFNIGFTPMKSSGHNRMTRQKGFISKDKLKVATTNAETVISSGKGKVSQQTGQNNRKPLTTRNYLETGI